MRYIHTAADMIPESFEVSIQTGHTTVPLNPKFDYQTKKSLEPLVKEVVNRLMSFKQGDEES